MYFQLQIAFKLNHTVKYISIKPLNTILFRISDISGKLLEKKYRGEFIKMNIG
jgi:hypothetical protein